METIKEAPSLPDRIDLPEIVNYSDMTRLTKKSYSTLSRWACRGDFRPGVYMGRGMFNLRQFKFWTEKTGTFLKIKNG